uniref:Calmodulin-lysine N-methyltransferase n=1 Tax=Poecilia latipinna TaxID=48699 RepID=A0A3B3TQY4_9TELE
MEKGSTGATEKTQSALPCKDKSDEDSCGPNSHNSREATCGATAGRARWTLLRQVLRQKQTDSPEVKHVSVRRFATFDLFRRKKLSAQEHCDTSDDQWVEYRSVYYPEYGAFLRDNLGPLKVNEVLNSFDNTGNVLNLTPTRLSFSSSLSPRGAVCELGGGMTCLGGLMVAISADVKEVLLSDGNEKSIQNVRRVVERNRQAGKFGSTHVSSRVVRWDCEVDISALEGHFDTVMCADCLFLDQYRACLVDAIRRLLRPNGMALVFAPGRGETLTLFCRLAQQAGLCVCQHQQYDAQVWDVHLKVRKES